MLKETRTFQTEVSQILDIMIHSLYSQREVFLRELISNASDAITKRRFEAIKDSSLDSADEYMIRLTPDATGRTLTITDNGIGMSYDEVVQYIGTIAHSGSKEFAKKAKDLKDHPELIGQFGVGFYSSFMVADKVRLHTQRAGSSDGVVWESDGSGGYTIDHEPRSEGTGTTITLFLKPKDDSDESYQDFTEEWTIRNTVKKYSDFVEYPIRMLVTREEPELDQDGKPVKDSYKKTTEDETLNSQKALWTKKPADITDAEYNEFFKHVSHEWNDPLDRIHYHAEGTQDFLALLYIPSMVPMDYYQRNVKWGLNLYVKKVFITSNCDQLIPSFLRFLKGVVDSSDLPLNVSREVIQKDRRMMAIRKAITSKVLRHLKTNLDTKRSDYAQFWEKFGATLKEGVASEYSYRDELMDLCLFHSTNGDEPVTLKEYVSRMKAEQTSIYYITGENRERIATSPYLEKLKKKGFEVLTLVDPVDEWVVQSVHEYDKKPWVSITREDLELDSESEKKQTEETLKVQEGELKPLMDFMRESLKDSVKDIKLSKRLVDSPACLVSGSHDPSAHMERIMEAMGHEAPKSIRILEINPDHAVIKKMAGLNDETRRLWSELLYKQALLNEGSSLPDPAAFSQLLTKLMLG